MTTNWNCTIIDVMPEHTDELGNTRQNVIKRIWWLCEAQGEMEATEIKGHTNLDISDLSDYTPIETMTTAQLESWALANMTEQEKSVILAEAQSHLDDLEAGVVRETIETYSAQ